MESNAGELARVVVKHDTTNRTFEASVGDELIGVVVYENAGPSRLALTHAAVEAHHRLRGVGTVLMSRMLDEIRANHQTVTVWCTAVVEFLEKHPEYHDLVDRKLPGRAPLSRWERTAK